MNADVYLSNIFNKKTNSRSVEFDSEALFSLNIDYAAMKGLAKMTREGSKDPKAKKIMTELLELISFFDKTIGNNLTLKKNSNGILGKFSNR